MTSMMRIESLSEKQDRAGRYWVRLSDGTSLKLYPQTVAEFDLHTDQELTEEELTRLKKSAGGMSAKMRAVRIVSASAVSARDLEDRLKRKGESPDDAEAAVAWMEEMSFVDDLSTAKGIIRRGLAKGYGINRLRQMLYEKKIPRELWDEVLENLPSPDEAICRFLSQKLSPEADQKEIKRAVDALVRRGHTWQDIHRCLSRWGENMEIGPEEL